MQFALQAVRQAALLARQVQAEMVTPALTKNDRSPVTVADFAAQALVAYLLSQAFPNDALVGEESAGALQSPDESETLAQVTAFVARFIPQATPENICRWIDRGGAVASGRYWTLDPVDGTKGFLRHDQYAVALALIDNGQVQLGVLGCPNLRDGHIPDHTGPGSLAAAQRGQGCWILPLQGDAEARRVQASAIADPAQARLLRSFEAGHTNVDQLDQLAQRLGVQAEAVRMDSQAKYAILACGGGEVIVRLLSPDKPDYKEKIWDQAAGSIVVEEAGGRISDLSGKALDFTAGRSLKHNRGILATNGPLHPAFLQGLADIGA